MEIGDLADDLDLFALFRIGADRRDVLILQQPSGQNRGVQKFQDRDGFRKRIVGDRLTTLPKWRVDRLGEANFSRQISSGLGERLVAKDRCERRRCRCDVGRDILETRRRQRFRSGPVGSCVAPPTPRNKRMKTVLPLAR